MSVKVLSSFKDGSDGLQKAVKKMKDDGVSKTFIHVFERFYKILEKDESSYIRESDITPVKKIHKLSKSFQKVVQLLDNRINEDDNQNLVDKTMIIKLNGGLGTTMGLDRAKSLLEVKPNYTFLDIIMNNLLANRKEFRTYFPILFMNSFRTSQDTLKFLEKYGDGINPEIEECNEELPIEIIQHHEPKLKESDLSPVEYPQNPSLEWCPPGHGDFYTAFYDSGALKKYLDAGFEYAFVSNADNLGAVFDFQILEYFADSDATIMLELADKTDADIKGGHIVRSQDGHLVLREVAQIHDDDKKEALDKKKHPYFNTNSIWLNLPKLYERLCMSDGVLSLPLITNRKRVNPNDKNSEKVIQMESAIASAIDIFDDATLINVPRSRFLPVKTHDDLELLRSKKYKLTKDFRLIRK